MCNLYMRRICYNWSVNLLSLPSKMLIFYTIEILLIGYFFSLIIHERLRVNKLETMISDINIARKLISEAHLEITKLTTYGESIISWNDIDIEKYHAKRTKVDSLLRNISKFVPRSFVRPDQIDSLCLLLESKEYQLHNIKRAIALQKENDSIFINKFPIDMNQYIRIQSVQRKRRGLAGLFGKTENVQIPYYTHKFKELNESLISFRNNTDYNVNVYADSIRLQNRMLNQKLSDFISFLDIQIQDTFDRNINSISNAQQEYFYFFVKVMFLVIILFIVSFFIILSDIRKEEKIKCRLKQVINENEDLLEMRKNIILTVSHDIRGPLGNIHNCADLISETREKKKREIYLDDIRHSCHHILHLVNDLMDAYRINEAGNSRNETPFNLNRFLQRISDEFSRKANIKALILYSIHENSILTVKGDADKLEQILENLLTNAIKFTPSGSIRFYTRYSEGKLHIEISDTGIGMDKETLKRVFSPFERAAQNVNSEGFGLGLFLTKGLIKILNGTITVESVPGKGSIFRIEVPLVETDEVVEEYKSDCNLITILPKKILVVDDDPIQLKIAEDMLGRNGITCTTCMNVRDVVAAIRQSDYDMILTDVQMPDTDGFALLKLLRNSDIGNSRTIPVAVMTARGDGNSGIYEKEGFAGCIHKPFNIHALLTFLSTIMSQTKVSQTGNFDFSCLLDSTDDYEHMLSLVVMESRKEIEELKTAIKTTNRESMRKTIHRMMPVWEILGKEHMLRNFQERLHDMNTSDETICEQVIQIIEWIEKLIKEAENVLKKHENTNS